MIINYYYIYNTLIMSSSQIRSPDKNKECIKELTIDVVSCNDNLNRSNHIEKKRKKTKIPENNEDENRHIHTEENYDRYNWC